MIQEGLIGTEVQKKYIKGKPGEPIKTSYVLDKRNVLVIDFAQKQHYLIIAKSGSGKSYLAGVIAEEIIKAMESNSGVIIVDHNGIFASLRKPNDPKYLKAWNEEMPYHQLKPQGMQVDIWVPQGDKESFEEDMYDGLFSLKASELTTDIFCHIFDLEGVGLQASLYRKLRRYMLKQDRNFSLIQMANELVINTFGFTPQTTQALSCKLEILLDLNIISKEGISAYDLVQPGKVIILDTSMSDDYTANTIVNFLGERLLRIRKQMQRKLDQARIKQIHNQPYKIPRPNNYIPPVMLIIDEAHNYLPNNRILRKYIKEGRNCGCIMTAISQSPDLDKHTYANITHLFVGQLIYRSDLDGTHNMLPVEIDGKTFRNGVKALDVGFFNYYNSEKKIAKTIKVRPRKTFHPAETTIFNEQEYFEDPDATYIINHLFKDKSEILMSDVPIMYRSECAQMIKDNVLQVETKGGCTYVKMV